MRISRAKITPTLFIFLSLLSCQKTDRTLPKYSPHLPGWQILRPGGNFQIQLPSGMQEIKAQGVDSFVGGFFGEGISLSFNYGMYSNRLNSYSAEPEYQEYSPSINGQKAKVIFFRNQSPPSRYKYHGAINIPPSGDSNVGLTIDIDFDDEQKRQTVKEIFESIVIDY